MPARKPAYLSALGRVVLLVPDDRAERYRVVSFDHRGQWRSMTAWTTKEKAKAERREMFAHHRKLAAETAARAAKRKHK